jgi:hypothetical protein
MTRVAKEWPKGGYDLSQWGAKWIGGYYQKYQISNYMTNWKSSIKIATHEDQTKNSTRTNVGPY